MHLSNGSWQRSGVRTTTHRHVRASTALTAYLTSNHTHQLARLNLSCQLRCDPSNHADLAFGLGGPPDHCRSEFILKLTGHAAQGFGVGPVDIGYKQSGITRQGNCLPRQIVACRGRELALGLIEVSLKRLQLRLQLLNSVGKVSGLRLEQGSGMIQGSLGFLDPVQRVATRHGFDAPYTRCNATLGDNLEQPDVSGASHVGTPTQLSRRTNIQHADHITVLFIEQCNGTTRYGFVVRHVIHLNRVVLQNLVVDDTLYLLDLRCSNRSVVSKVESCLIGVYQ